MSFLKTLMQETAAAGATGAGAIATGGGHETVADLKKRKKGSLWGGGVVDGSKRNTIRRVINMKESFTGYLREMTDASPVKEFVNSVMHDVDGNELSVAWDDGDEQAAYGILSRYTDDENLLVAAINHMFGVQEAQKIAESLGVDHGRNDFDASDVLSKIDAAQKKEYLNDDTTAFGLEDDQGNLVKVYVRSEQADDFESTLASMLAGIQDENGEEGEPMPMEIAEVLHELKDKFDIVDVEWPGIEGDEEEEQEVVDQDIQGGAAAGGAPGAEGMDMDAEGGAEIEGGDLGLGDEEGGEGEEGDMEADDESAKSALQAVIDVMKADAEAKMADAQAREAEARAKEAEYASQAAGAKVRREEQVFDMEAAEKEEKERKKEAEQQAKLARYQHQKAQGAEAKLSFESVMNDDPYDMRHDGEEDCDEITLSELTHLILKNLRHN